ncbi:MAG: dihydroxyacetone kinase subunit DhaL [Methylococcales bacterium]
MSITPALLPSLLQSLADVIAANAETVTALDQAIGDGDHVYNLQRGINALLPQGEALAQLDWAAVWQKIGFCLMSTVGGAAGSLYGTLFISMGKAVQGRTITLASFADIFAQGVEAVKHRGKADIGEKTLLDVFIPVANSLQQAATQSVALAEVLNTLAQVAAAGMESTRDMLATKGRASFLGERSRGHIDAGAKTAQLMIAAIIGVLAKQSTTPA